MAAPPYIDPNLTNGVKYYYRVRALADTAASGWSVTVWATPQPPPPATAPAGLTATPANARVALTWSAVAGATKYRVFRSTDAAVDGLALGSVTTTAFKDYKVTNGTTYYYRVLAANAGGDGPLSAAVPATPMDKPAVPTGLTATAGNRVVTLSWTAVPGADGYRLYRATRPGRQGTTPLVANLTAPTFVDNDVTNGPTYYYKVTAFNVGGESPRSAEASASPEAPPPGTDIDALGAFRFLRQSTWGPKPGDVERLRSLGVDAFLSEQFNAPASVYPDSLFSQPVEWTQEHFMHLALTGPDQLRQRLAWALHKIWVVSAVDISNAPGIVTYQRILMQHAFGNYRDLMRDMTLNPAMGRYLNMVNNKSQQVTGTPANENYAREILQLFTTGHPCGSIRTARSCTTRPDRKCRSTPRRTSRNWRGSSRAGRSGTATPPPCRPGSARENFKVPMEPVERYHDTGEKVVMGQAFPAGQTARQDLEQALDLLFTHANLGPFVSRQLIQQFVTSNPSPAYVQAVAVGVRGQRRGRTRRPGGGDQGRPHASRGQSVLARDGQAGRAGALRDRADARAQCDGDRSSVHERQGGGDGPEGLLPAVGLQLLLAWLPRAGHRRRRRASAAGTGVPDPHVGHGAGARELRRGGAGQLVQQRRDDRLRAVHRPRRRSGGAGRLTARGCSSARGSRTTTAPPSSPPCGRLRPPTRSNGHARRCI